MSNYLEIAKLAIGLIPVAADAIQNVEKILGPGKGAEKLATVRIALQNAYVVAGGAVDQFAMVWAIVGPVVEHLVPLLTKRDKPAA